MSFPRWRTLAGVSLAVLGVTATTAQAAPTDMVQELKVTIRPGKAGTKKKPKNTAIGVTINSPTSDPAATEFVDVFFSKGLQFNNRLFPTCSRATIERARSIDSCPKGSIVGRGRARATGFVGGNKVPEELTVTAVNSQNNTLLLFVKGTTPLQIAAPLAGKLVKAGGPYGHKLAVTIPESLRNVIPGTAYAALSFFTVDVRAQTTIKRGKNRGKKVGYVETIGCPKGGWPFRADFRFDPNAPFTDDPLSARSPNAKCS